MSMGNSDNPIPASPPPPAPPPIPRPSGGKFGTGVRILLGRLRFILLMGLVGLVAGYWDTIVDHYDRWRRPPVAPAVEGEHREIEYTCTMHPQVAMSEPGICPIPGCGMKLVPRIKGTGRVALAPGVLGLVQLTPQKMIMGRIETSPVEYRLLAREARTVGIIGYDEKRRATISARIKGRLDKLMVNYVGQKVDKGDPLALIYSPDLLVAQEELLSAARSYESQKAAGGTALAAVQAVLDAARSKLLLWGLTPQQVDEIIASKKPQTHMTIYAPIAGFVTEKKALEGRYVAEGEELYTLADLGNVWLQARIFPGDLGDIREGSAVEVTTTAFPNETFAGRITFVAYSVDPATQTVDARVEIDNPDYRLRVGMVVGAVIRQPVGKVIEISAASQPATGPAMAAAMAPATAAAPMSMPASMTMTAPKALTAPLASAYLKVASLFSRDQTDPAALADLAKQAAVVASEIPSAAVLAGNVRAIEGKPLSVQREAFKSISQAVMDILRQAPPKDMELLIAHCPMVNADWLTARREILNPYTGSEMLTCGEIVGPLSAAAGPTGPFVEGYYCPVHPDRIYDKSQACPVDQFGTKLVRAEKVLAVPASAIIDTGTRKIAYRESAPGVFDMIEVKLGLIAGEYYPVASGLKEGDRVATAGAFLVDAENRMNPSPGAQGPDTQPAGASSAPAAPLSPVAPMTGAGVHQH
jgi:membrane fusion protein, copper/silver efflux system